MDIETDTELRNLFIQKTKTSPFGDAFRLIQDQNPNSKIASLVSWAESSNQYPVIDKQPSGPKLQRLNLQGKEDQEACPHKTLPWVWKK